MTTENMHRLRKPKAREMYARHIGRPSWPERVRTEVREAGLDVPTVPWQGRTLRTYLSDAFAEESRPATVVRRADVDGGTAAVEYWALFYFDERPMTVSGCTVLRFHDAGLVSEAHDYSQVRDGHDEPPAGILPQRATVIDCVSGTDGVARVEGHRITGKSLRRLRP